MLLVPVHLVVLIQSAAFVRNRNDGVGLSNLLLRNSGNILGNPEQRHLGCDRWRVERVGIDIIRVLLTQIGVIGRDEPLKLMVVGVDPRLKELEEQVRLLAGRICVRRRGAAVGMLAVCAIALAVGTLLNVRLVASRGGAWEGQVARVVIVFSFKAGRKAIDEGRESLQKSNIEKDGEDQEDKHEYSRTSCLGDCKQTNHANLAKVHTDKQLLESTRVNAALCVDRNVGNIEDVVPESNVKEEKTNSRPNENEWRNNRVGDANDDDVCIHRKQATPENTGKSCPLVVHGTRSARKELIKQLEDDQANNLRENASSQRQTLHNEVRDVKVRCLRNTGRQDFENLAGFTHDHWKYLGCGIGQRANEEDLNDLEAKVCMLGEQLHLGVCRAAGKFGAESHNNWHHSHEDGESDSWEKA